MSEFSLITWFGKSLNKLDNIFLLAPFFWIFLFCLLTWFALEISVLISSFFYTKHSNYYNNTSKIRLFFLKAILKKKAYYYQYFLKNIYNIVENSLVAKPRSSKPLSRVRFLFFQNENIWSNSINIFYNFCAKKQNCVKN